MEASRLPLPDLVAGAVCASVGLAAFSALCSGGSAPSMSPPAAPRPERRLTPPPPRLNLRAAAAAASAGSPAKQTQWSPQLHEAELSRTRSGGRSSAESAPRSPWRHLRQPGAAKTPVGQGDGAGHVTQQQDAQGALSGPSPALVRQAAVAMLEEQQQALEQLRRECDGLKAALREVEAQRREPASPLSRAPPPPLPSAVDDGRSPAEPEPEPAPAGELWRAGFDAARNKPYFYNTATKETRWQSTTPEAGEQGEAAAEPPEAAAEDTALDRSSAFRPYEHRRGAAQAEASPGALEEQWSRDWWRTGGAEGSAQQPRSWRFTPSPVRPCPPALRTLARCFSC